MAGNVRLSARPVVIPTRARQWSQSAPADFPLGELTGLQLSPHDDGFVLVPGHFSGIFLSPVFQAEFLFNAIGVRWEADLPAYTDIHLELRASTDGRRWSGWQLLRPLDLLRDGAQQRGSLNGSSGRHDHPSSGLRGSVQPVSDLLFVKGRFLQYRATLSSAAVGASPKLRSLVFTYIDSTPGASIRVSPGENVAASRVWGLAKPAIISRAGWGANEAYRFDRGTEIWPRQYVSVTKGVVHHTVTSDGGSDPAAVVRAIYYYHAVTLGWGDIGYNFLIDKSGNIYEGRFGGDNVVGGHALQYNPGSVGIAALGTYTSAAPSSAMENAYVSFLTWAVWRYGIDPLGSGFFVDKTLPNLMGHRDAIETACPGDGLYGRIPTIRGSVWARMPDYGQAWISHNTPATMSAGATYTVTITLRNGGKKMWTATQRPIFRLGYHWYDENGNQIVQSFEDDKRTALPRDVPVGDQITLSAQVTAPQTEGALTLKWDMVNEGVVWFADTGAPTLDVAVSVSGKRYGVQWLSHNTPALMRPGATATVTVRMKNTGTNTWIATGKNAYRLGYHWYRSNGQQYVQSAEDDKRTYLPNDISPNQEVTVQAQVTAPRENGQFTLKWDMVHEGFTWFADQGNQTLNKSIVVTDAELNNKLYFPLVLNSYVGGW